MQHKIILDCDPGIDDALALFLALASPEIQFEAITTVNGNVPVEFTTRNALALLELTDRSDIPVARGCARPLLNMPVLADEVHGTNGLGGIILPEPHLQPLEKHATDIIIEKVMAAPGEITLVAIGPLTNLAVALQREPRLAQAVREVVLMGGAVRVPGNITPCAEFNIFVDPHAAHAVLHAGWPLRMVSLDTTSQTLLKRAPIAQLAAGGKPILELMQGMIDYYCDIFGGARGFDAIHMHDPLCMAAVFRPDLITWEEAYVDVELTGTLTMGETVGYFAHSGKPLPHAPNARVSVEVDTESFIQLFIERITQAYS
jgi:purine nucleosidase